MCRHLFIPLTDASVVLDDALAQKCVDSHYMHCQRCRRAKFEITDVHNVQVAIQEVSLSFILGFMQHGG